MKDFMSLPMKRTALFSVLATLLFPAVSFALTGDRSQPIEIVADAFKGDEVGRTAVYSGHVEVHQGTLEVLGDRLELVIDAKGYRTLTVTGKPVRMKEKRDSKVKGIEEWVHATSLKAVYEEKTDRIVLRDNARLTRSENGTVLDSTEGSMITYDLLHATSHVVGGRVDGKKTRISAVLSPRQKDKSTTTTPDTRTTPPKLRGDSTLRNR